MKFKSNHKKACLFLYNKLSNKQKILLNEGFTIQHLNYRCCRKRNEWGYPYGPTQETILEISIKSLPDGPLKPIYNGLSETESIPLLVTFNTNFEVEELKDFDYGFIANGYIIDVTEAYNQRHMEREERQSNTEFMLMHIQVLVNSFIYLKDWSELKKYEKGTLNQTELDINI